MKIMKLLRKILVFEYRVHYMQHLVSHFSLVYKYADASMLRYIYIICEIESELVFLSLGAQLLTRRTL